MSDDGAEALAVVDRYIDDAIEGLVSNARALESRPADKHHGAKVQTYLLYLERLYAVRRGLREA